MLPAFPDAAAAAPPLPERLRAAGLALRRAKHSDLPFLRALYGDFRALEITPVPWSAEQKAAFLDDQFRLQHVHFTRFFASADFWVVTRAEPPAAAVPIGRLYLDRAPALWRIIDIGFVADARGAGLGMAMLGWIGEAAVRAGAQGIALHVAANNPRARALYLRAGFRDDGAPESLHQPMLWRP